MGVTTAIHDLPYLTWLGSKAYASDIETSWAHRNAPREFAYVDGEAHEFTGRQSLKVAATLHWVNTIEPNLYPGRWRNFRHLLLSGQSGTLRHPDIGNFHARVESGSYTLTPEESGGVTVRVTWVESIKSADEPTKIVADKSNAVATAAAIDEGMALMGLDYPDGMPGDLSFEAAVNSVFSLGTEFTHELAAAIQQVVGLSDQVFTGIQMLGSASLYVSPPFRDTTVTSPSRPDLEFAINSLRVQLASALDVAKKAGGAPKTFVTSADQSLASLSLDLGSDISSLIRLNPDTTRSPLVSKGTKILYIPGDS